MERYLTKALLALAKGERYLVKVTRGLPDAETPLVDVNILAKLIAFDAVNVDF